MATAHALRGSENGNRYSPSGREVLTRSGVMIDVTRPRPDQVVLSDIAVSLAHQERFTGHCPLRPTVAQHSVAAEWIGGMLFQDYVHTDPIEDRLEAERQCRIACLMHDAPEFLVSDLNGAVKKLLRVQCNVSEFDRLESRAEVAIAERFDIDFAAWQPIIHEADVLACAYEMAWDGWCADAHPPRWVELAKPVQTAYRAHNQEPGGRPYKDGGEAAFLRRAAFLGLR